MNKKAKILSIILCLFLFLSFTGCGQPAVSPDPSETEPIKIGSLVSLTGPLAHLGQMYREGMELRLEENNYEVAGRPIKFVVEDDALDPTTAMDKIRKLVEVDNISILIGPFDGGLQVALGPFLAENEILTITLNGTYDEHHEVYNNWIGYPASGNNMAYTNLGLYAYDAGYRTMTTIGPDPWWGKLWIDSVTDAFEEKGGTVVQQQWFPLGTNDFAPYLVNLNDDADVLVQFLAGPDSTARFVSQYRDFGKKIPLLHLDMAGSLAANIDEIGDVVVGSAGQDYYYWTLDNPLNKEFVQNFENKHGRKPIVFNQLGYAAASIIIAGLEAAQGDESLEVLRPHILDLEVDTPQGPVSFTQNGFANTNRYIFEVVEKEGSYLFDVIEVFPSFVSDPWHE